MTLEATEKECAAVAKAPRVSLADIEAAMANVLHATGDIAFQEPPASPLAVLTLCAITMKNGFTVIGKSAPASPENFNAHLGRRLAYEDAVRQLWPLMGFALREQACRGVAPSSSSPALTATAPARSTESSESLIRT